IFLNFNTGMISFAVQRITGIALAAYLVLHVLTISAYRNGQEAFDTSVGKFDNTIGHFLEYFLLLAVLLHLLNGIRITLVDFFNLSRFQERMFIWCVIIFMVIALYSIRIFFSDLL
ncbi:MAG: succinate dehydrogenase, cytochrome b556 subunit, partial [Candidatus Schekmanbacteria bacterium RBG_13_48_7]